MFVSTQRHKLEIDRLAAELMGRDEQIAALEQRVAEVERTRHELIEEVRYVIQASGEHVGSSDSLRGEHLETLGHVLPYVLSRRRHWTDPNMPEVADSAVLNAKQLVAKYGFALPDDPVLAVKAMLDLATAILNPVRSVLLRGLQNLYPLTEAK